MPSSSTLPLPTATTLPSCGFSLAVSGMMIPPLVFSSSSTRLTRMRSCSGRIFMGSLLGLPALVPRRPGGPAAGVWQSTWRLPKRRPAQCIAAGAAGSSRRRVDFRRGFRHSMRGGQRWPAPDRRGGNDGPSPAANARSTTSCAISSSEHGYSPSLEEIGAHFGLSSVATVHKHVQHLVEKGYLRKAWNRSRSVEPVEEAERAPRSSCRCSAASRPARRSRRSRIERAHRGAPASWCGGAARPSCCACAATR